MWTNLVFSSLSKYEKLKKKCEVGTLFSIIQDKKNEISVLCIRVQFTLIYLLALLFLLFILFSIFKLDTAYIFTYFDWEKYTKLIFNK